MRRLRDVLLVAALVAVFAAAAAVVLHHPGGGTSFVAPAGPAATAPSVTESASADAAATSSTPTGPQSPVAGPVQTIATGDQITAGDSSWYALTVKADAKLSSLGNVAAADITTHDLLANFGNDVLTKHPQLVVIMGGSADAAKKLALPTTIANLRMMIKAATDAGAKVALCTVPPRNSVPVFPLNTELRKLASASGATLLDLHDSVSTPAGVWVPADTIDGVTPNAAGAQEMAKVAASALAKAGF